MMADAHGRGELAATRGAQLDRWRRERLAIETATPPVPRGPDCAGVEVTRVVDDGRRHTEALTGAMKDLLEEVG